MKSFLLSAFLASAICAQTVASFSPQATLKSGDVPWLVSITSPSAQQISVGKLYQLMIQHQVTPLSFQSAFTALNSKPSKSFWGHVITYASIGASIAAGVVTIKLVAAKQGWVDGLTAAGSTLTIVDAIATRQEPQVSPLITQIPHDNDFVSVPAGGSGSVVLLGSYQAAFTVAVQ
jgi:hypothetical protein